MTDQPSTPARTPPVLPNEKTLDLLRRELDIEADYLSRERQGDEPRNMPLAKRLRLAADYLFDFSTALAEAREEIARLKTDLAASRKAVDAACVALPLETQRANRAESSLREAHRAVGRVLAGHCWRILDESDSRGSL